VFLQFFSCHSWALLSSVGSVAFPSGASARGGPFFPTLDSVSFGGGPFRGLSPCGCRPGELQTVASPAHPSLPPLCLGSAFPFFLFFFFCQLPAGLLFNAFSPIAPSPPCVLACPCTSLLTDAEFSRHIIAQPFGHATPFSAFSVSSLVLFPSSFWKLRFPPPLPEKMWHLAWTFPPLPSPL